MNNFYKQMILLNLFLLSSPLISMNEMTSCYHEGDRTYSEKVDPSLLVCQALHAADRGDYAKARKCLLEAANKGNEVAVRYLAHSYEHHGLITGSDTTLSNNFHK